MSYIKTTAHALLTGGLVLAGSAAAHAELDETRLDVIVGNHTDPFTTEMVVPFFEEELAAASEGMISGQTRPFLELGLSGFEIMNLLKLGTNDISWGVTDYISGESPIVEGLILPGLTGDLEVIRDAQQAYRPILEEELTRKFNARLMLVYTQPKLQAYCNFSPEEGESFTLATMQGKKVRVASSSAAAFVESMGGVPVTVAFGDIIPALERGVLDCAITSPNAAYGYNFGQVTNYVVDAPAGFSTQFYAMNADRWNDLNEETQTFLDAAFARLEEDMAGFTAELTEQSVACLTEGPCEEGEASGMGLITLSEADAATLRASVEAEALGDWARRCGDGCAATWNETVGDIFGMAIAED